MTREDGVFTLKLDEAASLAMGMSFALDSGVNTEHIGVWWTENGELWFRSVVAERLHRIEWAGLQEVRPRQGNGRGQAMSFAGDRKRVATGASTS